MSCDAKQSLHKTNNRWVSRQPVSRVLSVCSDTLPHTGRSFLSTCRRRHVPAANPRLDALLRRFRDGPSLAAYSALLRLGFAVPLVLPQARWALTPPFHPYLGFHRGGLLSVALSVTRSSSRARPGVTWQPALWSPDFPRRTRLHAHDATVRPTTTHWSAAIYPRVRLGGPPRSQPPRGDTHAS